MIELFSSVQGETSLSGKPTTFIRLAACNLRCRWCDTTYSFGRGTPHSLDRILEDVARMGCRCVCITGGEPLLQANVYGLMQTLCDRGYVVSLETSGSLPTDQVDRRVKVILDIKCPGSEMTDKNHWANIEYLRPHDEVKFVLAHRDDYLFAKKTLEDHNLTKRVAEVLFAPAFGELDPKELISWILQDRLPVRLNMQIHKFIWSPYMEGV